MNKKLFISKTLRLILRIVSIVAVIVSLVIVVLHGSELTVENIAGIAPADKLTAAVFLIVLYALKGFTVFIPITLLLLVGGFVFNPMTAMAVNLIGLWVCMSAPYAAARYIGGGKAEEIIEKYPKLRKFETIQRQNGFFFSFLTRLVGFFPFDIVSMYMGYTDMAYLKYISGSMLGILPSALLTTFMGASVTEPGSPEFIISCGSFILLSVASLIIYVIYMKKRSKTENDEES